MRSPRRGRSWIPSKDAVTGSVATKADLQEVKTELQADLQEVKAELQEVKTELQAEIQEVRTGLEASIAGLRSEVEASIARLEARTQRFMFGMALGIVGLNVTLTFGLLKFFL